MNRWPDLTGCEKPLATTEHFRAMLREPSLTRAFYLTLIDATPVVGTAQQACELDRRLSRALAALAVAAS